MSVFSNFSKCILHINGKSNPLIQTLRFRKPRCVPIAKSKEFYVREPTPIVPEEAAILKEKYQHYRAAVKAVRVFLRSQTAKSSKEENLQRDLDKAKDFDIMREQAMQWNTEIGILREQRQNEEMRLETERLQREMEAAAQRQLQASLAAEECFEKNKVASKAFVTNENLDVEVEKMLESRSDYNFALTQEGKILEGEYPDRLKENLDTV